MKTESKNFLVYGHPQTHASPGAQTDGERINSQLNLSDILIEDDSIASAE